MKIKERAGESSFYSDSFPQWPIILHKQEGKVYLAAHPNVIKQSDNKVHSAAFLELLIIT